MNAHEILTVGQWSQVSRCTCCGRLRLTLGAHTLMLNEAHLSDLLAVVAEATVALDRRQAGTPGAVS